MEESALKKKENHYPGRRFLFKMGGKMMISTTKKTNHLRLLWTDPEVVLVFFVDYDLVECITIQVPAVTV